MKLKELEKTLRKEYPITYRLFPPIDIPEPWYEALIKAFRKFEEYNSTRKTRFVYVNEVCFDIIGLLIKTNITNTTISDIIIDADTEMCQICQICGTKGVFKQQREFCTICEDCYFAQEELFDAIKLF